MERRIIGANEVPADSGLPRVRQLVVDESSDGQRLDNFLMRELKGVPKALVYRVIRSGEVRVNRGRAAADTRVATGDQIRLMADLALKYSFDELRVTHAQNIVLPHVRKADLYGLWQKLADAGLAEANLDLISDIIACPGLDYCSLATARSIPVAQRISERFGEGERAREIGELKIKISGCINACGHHHVGHIGILGLERKGVETYQITLGGSGDETCSVGTITGPGFSSEEVVDAIERVVDRYLAVRTSKDEDFLTAYRRVGMAPFKDALYETNRGADI